MATPGRNQLTATRFTDMWLGKLRPAAKGKRSQYTDPGCPGLTVRIDDRGTKTWCARYTVAGRRQKLMTLGTYPDMSLSTARDECRDARRKGRGGIDKNEEQKEALTRRLAERERTIAALYEDFFDDKREKLRRERTARELKNHFRRTLEGTPVWTMPIGDVEPADLYDWLDEAKRHHGLTGVRKTAGALRDFYRWAIRNRYFRGVPPTAVDIFKVDIKAGTRSRQLNVAELRAVWDATEQMGHPRGSFYRFMLMTGQRLSQCLWLRRRDLNWEDGLWVVPAEYTKSGKPKVVPLARQTSELLTSLREDAGDDDEYVFGELGGDGPFVKHKVDHGELYELSGRTDWTPHDFRRTQRTRLAQTPEVKGFVADMLAGREGSEKSGVSGIYNQYDYMIEMREAAQAWMDWLEITVSGDETVVAMEAKG